jgi:uracil phosphoribosyltransferase
MVIRCFLMAVKFMKLKHLKSIAMKIHILNQQTSIANQFLCELRDTSVQTDRLRFRANLERLGELMAYEFSKTLLAKKCEVATPLGTSQAEVPVNDLVMVTVLRAGIPFYQGFLNIFDKAESGFIGAYREEGSEKDLMITLNYSALPNLDNKQLVLIDPMLATGKSLVKAFNQCLKYGHPKAVHIMSVISAPEGISYLEESIDHPGSIWTWAKDSHLNEMAYIVPGLGDAGDLSFGTKE